MLAAPQTQALPRTLDRYLGFEIRQLAEDTFVAFPQGWSHPAVVMLEASDLPALRKRIWAWWHRLLD